MRITSQSPSRQDTACGLEMPTPSKVHNTLRIVNISQLFQSFQALVTIHGFQRRVDNWQVGIQRSVVDDLAFTLCISPEFGDTGSESIVYNVLLRRVEPSKRDVDREMYNTTIGRPR